MSWFWFFIPFLLLQLTDFSIPSEPFPLSGLGVMASTKEDLAKLKVSELELALERRDLDTTGKNLN